MNVLILGANGFIGNSLVEHILAKTDWHITGLDLNTNNIQQYLSNPRFNFKQASMLEETQWVEDQIKNTDVVLPLVAIATPSTYVTDPLRIFELDFEANLKIVRLCVKHKKRIIFPSTSEVYGMCPDAEFDEETSNLVTGPIHKERWIYSCSKQMMDRIIYAYGSRGQLAYTLFRPFNWTGPKLDNILNPNKGGSRVVTQFAGNILRGEDITLVNGGEQKRSFIDIDDGIAALLKIIENKNNCAAQKIFNIGNPANDISIKGLAELLIKLLKNTKTKLINAPGKDYFGEGYQDVQHRVPSIKRAMKDLDWKPEITLEHSLQKTIDYHLNNHEKG
ncbi:MAG TPA: bifunctional UDP-4-keto-pentose/UDP-xylose synthase [Gammaproteobacteria bacterium]|nr:bifunctional UDP-4-keto-pentose/UDP-xylose synthase [Gammaproteobacteria bacterium]